MSQESIPNLKIELETLKKEKGELFDLNEEESEKRFLEIRARLEAFREKTVSPLERELRLKEQYEGQKKILEESGILQKLSTGELGITDEEGNEYSFPSYEEVRKRVRENKQVLQEKKKYGFTKLLITPFAVPMKDLVDKAGQVIVRASDEGKLFAPRDEQNGSAGTRELLQLNKEKPFFLPSFNPKGLFFYEPQLTYDSISGEFQETFTGKTKEKVVEEGHAWQLSFIQDSPNLRSVLNDYEGRKRILTGHTPFDYLKLFQSDPDYANEIGLSYEDWIMYLISHLEETGEVIDDDESGVISINLGTVFRDSEDYVSVSSWYRDFKSAFSSIGPINNKLGHFGVRTRVRI